MELRWAKRTIVTAGRPRVYIYNPQGRLAKSEDDCVGDQIAEVSGIGNLDNADMEKNASMLAAAPEMLDALQGVVRICEAMRYSAGLGKNQLERLDKARAAIAKATAA